MPVFSNNVELIKNFGDKIKIINKLNIREAPRYFKDDFIRTQTLNACANNLDNVPHKYPGVCSDMFNKYKSEDERSLYDWTEIFTERANHQSYSITEKENIQEAVGNLVTWIAKKKHKLAAALAN